MERPFKVWNAERNIRKSVIAGNLKQLLEKGRDKLGYKVDVTAVLEADGTEVDDEDYFRFLEDHTTFILLRGSEEWRPSQDCKLDEYCDAVDSSVTRHSLERHQLTGSAHAMSRDRSLPELCALLRKDFSQLVTFSRNELQTIVDASEMQLCRLLNRGSRDVAHIQLSCQRHLDEKRDIDDALQFVGVLRKSQEKQEHGRKRPASP